MNFVVMQTYAPNTNGYVQASCVCTQCCVRERLLHVIGPVAFQLDLSSTLNHTKNLFNSRTVVSYLEHQYVMCSFQVTGMCDESANELSERDFDACLKP